MAAKTPSVVPWPRSDSADEAAEVLLDELEDWIEQSIDRQKGSPWQGIHDEGSFASPWFAFHMIRPRENVYGFLLEFRDAYLEWAKEKLYHGYYPRQEAHHGPENWLYFQTRYASLDPKNALTAEILEDVVHHIGNWVDGIPEWFDWESRLFRGTVLGTRVVDTTPPNDINIAEHFRFVLLALAAAKILDNPRYLAWAEVYTTRWLEAFEAAPRIPIALHANLSPEEIETRYVSVRNTFLRAAPSDTAEAVNRIEAHVANGTIDALLDLHRLTGREMHRVWAKRLLARLIPTLPDTHNHPAGLLLMKYRALTGDGSLDERITETLGNLPAKDYQEYSWDPGHPWSADDLAGPGKRKDMIRWVARSGEGEWAADTSPSPSSLMAAYKVSGDEAFARWSLELACARLRVAKTDFADGRKHGCADRSVSAVVRGNGRCHNAGNVTGSLFPYLAGIYDVYTIPTQIEG